jgi:hypothetical protein
MLAIRAAVQLHNFIMNTVNLLYLATLLPEAIYNQYY